MQGRQEVQPRDRGLGEVLRVPGDFLDVLCDERAGMIQQGEQSPRILCTSKPNKTEDYGLAFRCPELADQGAAAKLSLLVPGEASQIPQDALKEFFWHLGCKGQDAGCGLCMEQRRPTLAPELAFLALPVFLANVQVAFVICCYRDVCVLDRCMSILYYCAGCRGCCDSSTPIRESRISTTCLFLLHRASQHSRRRSSSSQRESSADRGERAQRSRGQLAAVAAGGCKTVRDQFAFSESILCMFLNAISPGVSK